MPSATRVVLALAGSPATRAIPPSIVVVVATTIAVTVTGPAPSFETRVTPIKLTVLRGRLVLLVPPTAPITRRDVRGRVGLLRPPALTGVRGVLLVRGEIPIGGSGTLARVLEKIRIPTIARTVVLTPVSLIISPPTCSAPTSAIVLWAWSIVLKRLGRLVIKRGVAITKVFIVGTSPLPRIRRLIRLPVVLRRRGRSLARVLRGRKRVVPPFVRKTAVSAR